MSDTLNILQFIHLLDTQRAEMDRSKWIESEKAHRDLGRDDQGRPSDAYYLKWVKEKGYNFRVSWEASCCKSCQNYQCKEGPKNECSNYYNNLRLRIIEQDSKVLDIELINIETNEVMGRFYLVAQKVGDEVKPVFLQKQ